VKGTPIVASFIHRRADAHRARDDVPRAPAAAAAAVDDGECAAALVVAVGSDRDDARAAGIDAIRPGDATRRARRG